MVAKLLLSTLRHVAELLDREGIVWAVAGGIALSVWDHARSTKDADLLIGVVDRDVDTMLATFQKAGLRPKRYPPIVVVGKQRFAQLLYQPDEIDFEIQVDFIFAEQPFQQEALARRLATGFPDWNIDAFVLTCEDLIVFKLVSGRIIDLADSAALLRANRDTLDYALLRRECAKLGLSTELARIWDEAFPDTNMPEQDA
ncbi:MAG: hypothetical protein O3C40_05695 [Planctomycetota bacterium]|nr:hypothetical protein [Planctomycetota bacterium]